MENKLATTQQGILPRTKEEILTISKNYPDRYYAAINPVSEVDVFRSPSAEIALIRKEHGETFARAFMVGILADIVEYFSVGKSMGATQVAQTIDLILSRYYYFKPDDFKLCFNRAKQGYYGKVYDRLDGQVIFDWLNQYDATRTEMAMQQSDQEQYSETDNHERGAVQDANILHDYKLKNLADKYGTQRDKR